jgi:single-strand DNA-binding protein
VSKETEITVIGNVVNSPQKNRTANGSVTNFRVASTAQRFDREMQRWVDKKPLFLDVECWGELGGNVSHTLTKGDPVIVFGELYTDEWESDQGRRSRAKVRAAAVGPDLTRGTADFRRTSRSVASPEPAPEGDMPRADVQEAEAQEGEPQEVEAHEVTDGPAQSEDYREGSTALYELDSDDALLQPALH